jgi:AbrB family looped-hinge helix DNA binding protein
MNGTIIMGRSRRIVLPKELCRQLRIKEGDSLEVMVEGDCLKLRPQPDDKVNLVREGGLLVTTGYLTGAEIGEAVLADRADREETLTRVYQKNPGKRVR